MRVASALEKKGHRVQFVRCNGTFSSHCVAMSGMNVGFPDSEIKKKLVCHSCNDRRKILNTGGLGGEILFSNFQQAQDHALIDEKIHGCTPENWHEFEFDGQRVGRLSAYEFLLTHKIDSFEIPQHLWDEFLNNLRNTMLTVIVSRRILKSTQPDCVLVYNSLYSLHNAYVSVAKSMGINTRTVQGGPHVLHKPNTLTSYRTPMEMFNSTYASEFDEWLSCPIDKSNIELVSSHLQALLLGQSAFVYSTAPSEESVQKISQVLGIDGRHPVLTILLSSEDEYFAAEIEGVIPVRSEWKRIFVGQLEWLEWLINFAARTPNYYFVVRMHPRMMPNKRESVEAPFVKVLEELLTDLPDNVRVNYPGDNISIYDLMQFTDVVLNKRSSAGIEMMAYGLPVVLPGDENLFSCSPSVCTVANDLGDYERLIHEAVVSGWSLENIRKSFRWYAYLFAATAVEVNNVTAPRITFMRPKRSSYLLRLWKVLAFYYLQLGPRRSERIDIGKLRDYLDPIYLIVDSIVRDLDGLHNVNLRSRFPESNFEIENNFLVADLIQRVRLLETGSSIQTPLMKKISASINFE